jgi:hypothetical protein
MQLGIGLIAVRVHQHVPGSLLARTPGTSTAAEEIRLIGVHLGYLALTIVAPLIPLLAVSYTLSGLYLDEHGHALVDPGTMVLLPLALRSPWLLVVAALRCGYAVHRYNKIFLLWTVLGVTCVLGATVLIDGAIQAAREAFPSPRNALLLLSTWTSSLTLPDLAVVALACIGLLGVAPVISRRAADMGRTGAKLLGNTMRNPRVTGSAGLAVLVGAAVGLPPSQACLLLGAAVSAYTVVELHNAGVLARTIATTVAAAVTLLLFAVTVVISFTIQKLPQLTATEVKQAATSYRIQNNLVSTSEYVWMAVQTLPTVAGIALKAVAAYAAVSHPAAATVAVVTGVAQTLSD